jgi:hypothetical protein
MEHFDAIHPTGVAANQNGSIIPGRRTDSGSTPRVLHQTSVGGFGTIRRGDSICPKYYLVMALPASRADPAGMPHSNEFRNRHLSSRRLAMPAAVAGAALLGLSLLLSVGPALGAANHSNGDDANGNGSGTSGTLKVHDSTTGVETSGNGNEPQVCDFWLGFTSDTSEIGTWIVVSWPPTGDGSTVASGAYNTSGDGADSSNIIELPAGHYRAEWAATGETLTSKKTFWVDADCDEAVTPVDDPPAYEGAPPADESGAEDPAPPADEGTPPVDEPPGGESVLADEGSQPEDPGNPSDESPIEESVLTGAGSPADDPGTQSDESPTDNSPADEPAPPSGESAPTLVDPSGEEDPAQAADPGTTDSPAPPVQDQLDGTGTSVEPTMSDTATPAIPVPTGLVATLGLLLLILAHATIRGGKLRVPARG